MRVLVACEESQAVCTAFRERGHEAYSCDIQPCSGGHPEWHIQADATELIKLRWDLLIAHPQSSFWRFGMRIAHALQSKTLCLSSILVFRHTARL